jgi:thiamine transport system permease protein
MSAGDVARFLERPMLREVLPGLGLTIFLICLTSFAVALTLGGGPGATTVELAIYQAFRFDFDPGRAAMLAALQAALCLAVTFLALRIAIPAAFGGGLDRVVERWDAASRAAKATDIALLVCVAAFLLGPVSAILIRGLPHLGELPASVWPAILRSVCVALASVALMMMLALPLALARARWSEGVAMMSLAASPLVVGTGVFLIVRAVVDPALIALPLTVLVNAVMALPFAMRALAPAARAVETDFGRLADSLGMAGQARFRWVTLPRLWRPAGFAAGLTGALSMGDLGVVTLFAGPDQGTLPLVMFRLMGAYRMDAAYAAAVILLGLSLAIFWVFDRGGRADAAV